MSHGIPGWILEQKQDTSGETNEIQAKPGVQFNSNGLMFASWL